MTRAERKARYRQLMKQQAKYENTWQPRVMAALRAQSEPFIANMMQNGPDASLLIINSLVLPNPINDVLQRLYLTVGVQAGNEEYAHYLKAYPDRITQTKAFGFNSFWREALTRFFNRIGGEKVQSITQTEKNRIRAVLEQSADEGLTNYQLAQRLRSDAINEARARLITRTETGSAGAIGQELAAEQSGLSLRKVWISAQRATTRRLPQDQFDHFTMDGVSVLPGEKFFVMGKLAGEFMDYPHDPAGSAGNVCNCLCACIREPV